LKLENAARISSKLMIVGARRRRRHYPGRPWSIAGCPNARWICWFDVGARKNSIDRSGMTSRNEDDGGRNGLASGAWGSFDLVLGGADRC